MEVKAKHSSKCLDVDKGIGPKVHRCTCNDSPNQKYLLITNLSFWDCYLQTTQRVGRVEIWWGHSSTDGVWACNTWVPDCQNNCNASSSSTVTPSISIILSTSQPIGIPESGAWTIMEQIASVVGIASALVGAAFACAKWKRKMNSTSTSAIQTTVARSTDMTSSRSTASATVPQSTDVILRCQVNQIQCKDQGGQVLACTCSRI